MSTNNDTTTTTETVAPIVLPDAPIITVKLSPIVGEGENARDAGAFRVALAAGKAEDTAIAYVRARLASVDGKLDHADYTACRTSMTAGFMAATLGIDAAAADAILAVADKNRPEAAQRAYAAARKRFLRILGKLGIQSTDTRGGANNVTGKNGSTPKATAVEVPPSAAPVAAEAMAAPIVEPETVTPESARAFIVAHVAPMLAFARLHGALLTPEVRAALATLQDALNAPPVETVAEIIATPEAPAQTKVRRRKA